MNIFEDVRSFHKKFHHPSPASAQEPDTIWREQRKKLILEEARELVEAIDSSDLGKIAREACDLIYVAVGTIIAYGLPWVRCWRAVHRANMEKSPAPPGEKPGKPEGWVSPDAEISNALDEQAEAQYH